MKNSLDFETDKLLPLRIAGVDHHHGPEMELFMKAASQVADPLWTHFPKISATRGEGLRRPSDLLVHPSMLDLNLPATTDGGKLASTRNAVRAPLRAEADAGQLRESMLLARKRCAGLGYITPSQLVLACIDSLVGASGINPPRVTRSGNHLLVSLRDLPEQARATVAAILYMMRELAYGSRLNACGMPKQTIAIEGGKPFSLMPPIPYTPADPPLDLGEQFAPNLRYVSLHKPLHSMVLGASGTGKTYSVVVAALKAHLHYKLEDGTQGAALVVDPKKELAGIAEEFLVSTGESARFFLAGRDGPISVFPRNTSLSLADRVALLLEAANVNPHRAGDSGPWVQKSMALLQALVHAHAVFYNASGRDLYLDLLEEAGRDAPSDQGYWVSVSCVLKLMQEGIGSIRWMHQRMCAFARKLKLPPGQRTTFELLARYASMDDEGANQISYVTGGLEGAMTFLGDTAVAQWLDLSPIPEINTTSSNGRHDIHALIESSKVIVFQPNNSPGGDVGARLLKAQFYRAAMERENLRQPILFLCDEFQRFVTADRESGETSLLDRCRAYRITAVLATQSVTALCDAISKQERHGNPTFAVNCILSNIAYMFYFQTLDECSEESLKATLPVVVPPGWRHPLEFVPLSAMRVGEAYYVAPEGRWGRTQFKMAA